MQPSQTKFIVLADRQIADRRIYVRRIWQPARIEHRYLGGRRAWLDAMTLIFEQDGNIFWPDGRPFELPEIDDAFTDIDNRWMSNFLKADPSGELPALYCRTKGRLRLIALYCDIRQSEEPESFPPAARNAASSPLVSHAS